MSDRDAIDEPATLAEPHPTLDGAPEPADPATLAEPHPTPDGGPEPHPDLDGGPESEDPAAGRGDDERAGRDAAEQAEAPEPPASPTESATGAVGVDGGPGGVPPDGLDGVEGRLRPAAPESGGARRARVVGPKVSYKRPTGQRERGASGKRKKTLILGFVVFVVVVGVGVMYSLRSGGSGVAVSARTSAAPASPVSYRFQLVTPARIGGWSALADQMPAEQFRNEVAESGVERPYAAIYADSASNSAIAWGGVGTSYGTGTPDSRLDTFFVGAGRNVGGGTAGPRTDVDPGALGGKAQCATVAGVGISMVVCGWTGDHALMGLEFSAGTLDQDLPMMKSMLAAIVLPAGSD